jgi:hypothetical protein
MTPSILMTLHLRTVVASFLRSGTIAPGANDLNSFWTSGSWRELKDQPAKTHAHKSWFSKSTCSDGERVTAFEAITVNDFCFLLFETLAENADDPCFLVFCDDKANTDKEEVSLDSVSDSTPFSAHIFLLTQSGQ